MGNPILHRELMGVLRQRRTALLQCGVAVAFALLVALRWPTEARMALSGSRSLEVFRLFAYGLLAAILLLLPVFPATNIVRERNSGTLALLLNTPLGPWRIFWGKWLGIMALAGLILAASLPAAAACYSLGGVSLTGDLLAVYGLLLLCAGQYTALGLLVSTRATTTDAAVRWTYGLVLLLSVLTLVPHHFFLGSEGPLNTVVEWVRCASPFAALMALQGAADVGSQGLTSDIDIPSRFALVSLGLTVVFSWLTISRLNHTLFDRSRAAGKISNDQGAWVQLVRRLIFIVDPQRRSGAIPRFINPVMVKEFRCRKFGRLHWLLRLIAICAVLSLGMSILSVTQTIQWEVETIGGILVLLQVALLVLITPSLTAGLLTTELETGGWTLLRMTPLPIWRIVWGKLLSVTLTLILVLFATLPGYLVMVYIEPGQADQVQRVVICLLFTAVFGMLCSAAVGSLFQRTTTATAAAYTSLLLVCGAPLLIWLGRDAPFGHDTVERALTVNPIAAALTVIRLEGFRDYDLIPANWWFLGLASVLSVLLMLTRTWSISRPQ